MNKKHHGIKNVQKNSNCYTMIFFFSVFCQIERIINFPFASEPIGISIHKGNCECNCTFMCVYDIILVCNYIGKKLIYSGLCIFFYFTDLIVI